MLTVVLTILKIIGIILLIILGMILLVLFVPIRYSVDAEIPQKDLSDGIDEHFSDGIMCNVRITWLLHLIRACVKYPAAKSFSVKILFFTVFPRRRQKQKKSVKDAERKADILKNRKQEAEPGSDEEEMPVSNEISDGSVSVEDKSENWDKYQPEKVADTGENSQSQKIEDEEKEKNKEENIEENINKANPEQEKKEQGEEQSEEAESEKKTIFDFWRKCKDIALHIWNFLRNQQNVLKKTWYTISRICDKISLIKETLESDIFQRAWKIASLQLLKVWKQLRPGICNVTIIYGTGDPALTAQILGIYAMMYPSLPDGISVDADFNTAVIGCTAHIRGKITLFRLLWCAAVIYFNKDIRKIYRRFRKILKR